ncbi:hypothetical protein BGZ65_011874 [Modicella reniformis]|uniref:Uncharacterized protein n=1 Tax=Modicella reniformis TaxID=1440133 RepID=A0A9P6LR72_9FUNG|nr:hypothetical protein BGZ65_011874 [Modicella reniformis]
MSQHAQLSIHSTSAAQHHSPKLDRRYLSTVDTYNYEYSPTSEDSDDDSYNNSYNTNNNNNSKALRVDDRADTIKSIQSRTSDNMNGRKATMNRASASPSFVSATQEARTSSAGDRNSTGTKAKRTDHPFRRPAQSFEK